MGSPMEDAPLARRYIASIATIDELQTIVEYILACKDAISERKAETKRRGSGYGWVREYEALQAAWYVCRLLLERHKHLAQKDKHDLFSRGYETKGQIEHAARG